MNEQKHLTILIGFVLSISLLSTSLTAVLLTNYHNRISFQFVGNLCAEILEKQPETAPAILSALKSYQYEPMPLSDENLILIYGYQQTDFVPLAGKYETIFAFAGFLVSGALFLLTLFFWRRKQTSRIKALTDYLEKINIGKHGVLLPSGEDDCSKLQDEIYKTVTKLYQTRDEAIQAKNNFAENLSNIAHQLKTPITSISLSIQMIKEDSFSKNFKQIQQQLFRLTHLEEALLLLSRMDAGTLSMERKKVDVFTLLMLATENLQELLRDAKVSVDIPEAGETIILADLEWTMEAVINLLKNCIEHTPPGGMIHCSYKQNPLYTQIQISDTGNGFAKEDIPHLFEQFYQGKGAKKEGIGLGLALSKTIIERQNGIVKAQNRKNGGACFEIRFYSH